MIRARATVGTMAFSKAARVMMSRGLMSRLISSSSALRARQTLCRGSGTGTVHNFVGQSEVRQLRPG